MADPGFVTVFNLVESGYRNWTFPAFGLIFAAIGAILLLLFKAGFFPEYQRRIFGGWFFVFYMGFSVLWTLTTFLATFGQYRTGREALLSGKALYVEGPVQHFVPMPYTGHAMESFDVKGVGFHYSDYVVSPGFNQTESHGGPIHSGTYVRVWYSGNDILKLQVRK